MHTRVINYTRVYKSSWEEEEGEEAEGEGGIRPSVHIAYNRMGCSARVNFTRPIVYQNKRQIYPQWDPVQVTKAAAYTGYNK